MTYTVYTGTDCPNCTTLISFLNKNQIKYTTFNVRENDRALQFLRGRGYGSIPQVFLDGRYIGDHNTAITEITNVLRGLDARKKS